MAHKPIGCFTTFEDYVSEETNPELDELGNNAEELKDYADEDDFRTEKEKRDDMGDYLRDRSMDLQHELKERDCGAR